MGTGIAFQKCIYKEIYNEIRGESDHSKCNKNRIKVITIDWQSPWELYNLKII